MCTRDSVDHTLKRLPSLFAAVVVDHTLFQAVGKSHKVLQQLQPVIDLFSKHAEEVTVVFSENLEISHQIRQRSHRCAEEKGARDTW